MMGLHMRAEHLALARWTAEAADYVKRHDLDIGTVIAFAGSLTIINCWFLGNGHFVFDDDDGVPAIVTEIYGEDDGTTIDLCAWPIDRPESFATYLGSDALGMARVVNPATWSFGGVLNIYRTPLKWLQAECRGCCILDHRYVCIWLGEVPGAIQAEDAEHAKIIDRLLNPPRFDRRHILFPRNTERPAA